MDKRSRILIGIFLALLVGSIAFSYYRFILTQNFEIDESAVVEEVEESDEIIEGELPSETEE